MIILRKLLSDKKGNKKKEVVESKEGEIDIDWLQQLVVLLGVVLV